MLFKVNKVSEEFIFIASESAEMVAEVTIAGASCVLKSTCGLGSLGSSESFLHWPEELSQLCGCIEALTPFKAIVSPFKAFAFIASAPAGIRTWLQRCLEYSSILGS